MTRNSVIPNSDAKKPHYHPNYTDTHASPVIAISAHKHFSHSNYDV